MKRGAAAVRREERFECSETFSVLFQLEETRSARSFRHKKPKNSPGRAGGEMIFPSVGKDRAWLCCTSPAELPGGLKSREFLCLQWNYLLPAPCISESSVSFPFLPWLCLDLLPSTQRVQVTEKASFPLFFLSAFALAGSCPEFQGCGCWVRQELVVRTVGGYLAKTLGIFAPFWWKSCLGS